MIALVDTKVVLDVMLGREPHLVDSAAVLAAIETSRCGGLVCATTITKIFYLAERQIGSAATRGNLANLLTLFRVAPVNHVVLRSAIALGMQNFEDAVLHEAAIQAGADCIVTRNVDDFELAGIPVYTPARFLAALAVMES